MFEDGRFKIYEATTKKYIENKIYNTIGGPNQDLLMMRKTLDYIKIRYYEISIYGGWA